MFLTYDRVFPTGATEADLLRIVRPRPDLPFTRVDLGGRPRLLWTTFTPHQIDLDVHHPDARAYLSRVLRRLADCGVTMVRLDAVGYTVKTAGTSCFLTPETFAFVDDLAAEARGLGLRGARRGARAPPARARRRGARRPGLRLRPRAARAARGVHRRRDTAAPVADRPADEHRDGARHPRRPRDDRRRARPVARGLLSTAQIEALVERIADNSGGTSMASRVPSGVYQVSCTAYDALGRDDGHYLLARASAAVHAGDSAGVLRRSARRPQRDAAPATPARSTAAATPRAEVDAGGAAAGGRERCWSWSGCATRTRPSRASSACPTLRTGSWRWRGATATPPPSCGSHSRVGRGG